jgi:hypothetical protein
MAAFQSESAAIEQHWEVLQTYGMCRFQDDHIVDIE